MAITPKQPLKLPPSKQQVKSQLQQDVETFLASGGEVTEVPKGLSGVVDGNFNRSRTCFAPSATVRTPLPDVVANIEQRKQAKRQSPPPALAKRHRKPQKKWIYDDFGEPLRWVWSDK